MQNRREITAGLLLRLNDPGYKLQGEDPNTATLEDARGWAGTYDTLIRFKHELLDLCQKCAEQSGPEVARAIRETDVVLLEIEISRFQQKRDYWKIRATELAGNGRRGDAS